MYSLSLLFFPSAPHILALIYPSRGSALIVHLMSNPSLFYSYNTCFFFSVSFIPQTFSTFPSSTSTRPFFLLCPYCIPFQASSFLLYCPLNLPSLGFSSSSIYVLFIFFPLPLFFYFSPYLFISLFLRLKQSLFTFEKAGSTVTWFVWCRVVKLELRVQKGTLTSKIRIRTMCPTDIVWFLLTMEIVWPPLIRINLIFKKNLVVVVTRRASAFYKVATKCSFTLIKIYCFTTRKYLYYWLDKCCFGVLMMCSAMLISSLYSI